MNSEILARVIRGETLESVHRGHLLIVDGAGNEIARAGDVQAICFIRSSAKPFQAMPFLTSGAADHFGYTKEEIALACASHSGESFHVALAAQMLEKINLSEADLRCGAHLPFSETRAAEMLRAGEEPTPLHNNCSGKHAAMLAFAKYTNADLETYERSENPVQQAILETIAKFTETPLSEIPLGIDGCAAPNYALKIGAMAKSFLNLIRPPADFDSETVNACGRIVAAMLEFPELVGGSSRLDTMLMRAAPGKFISKIGAEGVWLAGILPSDDFPHGLGIAMKIEDGDDKRARAVIAVEILRRLRIFAPETLAEISPLPILNRRGDTVGRVEANLKF